jgi:hypothetical protein
LRQLKLLRKNLKRSLKLESKFLEKLRLKGLFPRLLRLRESFKLKSPPLFQLKYLSQLIALSKNSSQFRDKSRRLCKLFRKLRPLFRSKLRM